MSIFVAMIRPGFNNGNYFTYTDDGGPGPFRRNWDMRLQHQWAMRKLAYLQTVRPVLGTMFCLSIYWFPRELFSQNFGRKNRRYWFDMADHVVGMSCFFMVGRYVLGTMIARYLTLWCGFFIYWYAEVHYSYSNLCNQYVREFHVPKRLATYYGLPDGGEGYDTLEGAEQAYTWRTEAQSQRWYLMSSRFKVRNSTMYENHPWYRTDFGWGVANDTVRTAIGL